MKKNCALPCCLRAGLTVAVKPPVTKPIALTFMLLLLLAACRTDFQPRPKGYNRLQLPQPEYRVTPDSLPYRFEYSIHARLLKDTSQVSEKDWVEIYYPSLGATLHITYKPIGGNTALLKEYLNDAYVLTAKHQVKAYAIDESISRTNSGKTAVIAEIEGEVPSQFQFTMTDSTRNFLRGALYFNVKVHNDSLQPAIEYMKKEAMHLINSLQWKP